MKERHIRYAQYNLWANRKLVNLLAKLDNTVVEREIVSSFPSIRKTVLHNWGAERGWLSRLKEEKPTFRTQDFKGTINEVYAAWTRESEAFLRFIEEVEVAWFNQNFPFKSKEGKEVQIPAGEIIHHVFNHATYHRGQIVTMLRQCGVENIGSMDYFFWLKEEVK